MDGLQGATPFDAVFPGDQEQNGRADKDDGTDAGLERLDEIRVVIELELVDAHHHEHRQRHDRHAQHGGRGAERKVRPLDPPGPRHGFFSHLLQFRCDFAQAGTGETPLNAPLQSSDRLDDLVRVQPAIFRNDFCHSLAAA